MNFLEDLDLLWFTKNSWSEKFRNEHFGQNNQTD